MSLVVFAVACTKQPAEDAPVKTESSTETTVVMTEAQYTMAGIKTGRVEKRAISKSIKATGFLDVPPQQLVSVSVPYGGILKSTELLEGMWVDRGQVIAVMEHPDYVQLQQEYVDATGQLQFLKLEYERQQELNKENVTAAKTFQKTEADYNTVRAKVQALTQKLAMINITPAKISQQGISSSITVTAPINGYVTQVNANIGKFVTSNDVLFQIVDTRHLHAEVTIFEKDLPFVNIEDKVRFILANETKERIAHVHLIGRNIGEDRTVRLHCHIDVEDKNMLPGMYLKAWIESKASAVTALPESAFVQANGKNYIFTKSGERTFQQVEVEKGVSEDGYTEITLPENFDLQTEIVTTGAYTLLSTILNSGE
jgi:cobalt-zinc-cadmium efflux system membrane fusion protein